MAQLTEKRLYAVPPTLFTADGDTDGTVKVANAAIFTVKQHVHINATGLPLLVLEVKRITDKHTVLVGPVHGAITLRTDLSLYTVALGANISANEQTRPKIPEQDVERATYQDEPVVARRVFIVDELGDGINDTNPLPVAATFSGTVTVGDVRITAHDNDPVLGDIHSDVRINDGTNDLKVNPDGSINVIVESGVGGSTPVNQYSAVSSVASGVSTTILTYTVPVGKVGSVYRIEYGGDNFARFDATVNSVTVATGRTWFGDFKDSFEFAATGATGYPVVAGDIIKVLVLHNRPFLGSFEARLQATLT